MAQEIERLKRRKRASKKLEELYNRDENILVIHYSCEGFYDRPDGKTPRITSIAVRNFISGQTESFSIHKIAEQQNIAFDQISTNFDELESEMLKEFFDFVAARGGYYWVHWNMRDINYGFVAIEHRYKILGGSPIRIEESKKFDLSRALVAIFGPSYIGHPRLETLVKKNNVTAIDCLSGQAEAEAFENGDYVRLHQSTLRKVAIIADIMGCAVDRTLKTDASWFDTNGIRPRIIGEIIKEHWITSIVGLLASLIGIISFCL